MSDIDQEASAFELISSSEDEGTRPSDQTTSKPSSQSNEKDSQMKDRIKTVQSNALDSLKALQAMFDKKREIQEEQKQQLQLNDYGQEEGDADEGNQDEIDDEYGLEVESREESKQQEEPNVFEIRSPKASEQPKPQQNPFALPAMPTMPTFNTSGWMSKLKKIGEQASTSIQEGVKKAGEGLDQIIDKIDGTDEQQQDLVTRYTAGYDWEKEAQKKLERDTQQAINDSLANLADKKPAQKKKKAKKSSRIKSQMMKRNAQIQNQMVAKEKLQQRVLERQMREAKENEPKNDYLFEDFQFRLPRIKQKADSPEKNQELQEEKRARAQHLKKFQKIYKPQIHCLWTMPPNSTVYKDAQELTDELMKEKFAQEKADVFGIQQNIEKDEVMEAVENFGKKVEGFFVKAADALDKFDDKMEEFWSGEVEKSDNPLNDASGMNLDPYMVRM